MAANRRKRRKPTRAQQVDKYALYLKSVQEPEFEVGFFDRVYRKQFGEHPAVLREDFCGTAAVCCEWVKSKPYRRAVGVDLDAEPLAWSRGHLLGELTEEQRRRVELRQEDVRTVSPDKADVIAAQNFSFFLFKTREELRKYFEFTLANLADRGVLVLDMMGGSEVFLEEHEDVSRKDGFKYIWEQARFDPITHDAKFYIHFKFKDGSRLDRAFRYDWRIWTIPEVRELLAEAGYDETLVYWEGTDPETGEGDSVFRPRRHAPADPAWIAYLAAVKHG